MLNFIKNHGATMKKAALTLCIILALGISPLLAAGGELKITVIYDNYPAEEGMQSDWGFSCLIEGLDKTILFDTGTKPEIMSRNLEKLEIDLAGVEQIVITHNHGDHTGGLDLVLKQNPDISVYFPDSFPQAFSKKIESYEAKPVRVKEPLEICGGAFLTGEMGERIKEQSLVLDTPKGLIIVTGCSHQGIVNILKKAKEIRNRDVYLVFGGFHLMDHSEDQLGEIIQAFKSLGVEKCGATHCTGDKAIDMFKAAFGPNFVPMGTGKILTIQ
jgi:7,8-dihydropterin-6-yl-methyl-4-(beta-D-ribofuranosyl)aminobenzene 5'-phosphate synthase